MSARWAPHWQLLSAGWRMSGKWSAFRLLTIGLLVVGLACLAGATPLVQKPANRQLFAVLSVVPLALLWLLHSTELMRFNHPVDARLVPRQLRCLQETLLGMWLTLIAAALVVGLPFGNSIWVILLVATAALLPLLWIRWPLLLVPVVLIWLAPALLGDTTFVSDFVGFLQGVVRPILDLYAWGFTLATLIAMLALARLLTHGVLRPGGDAHTSRFRASLRISGKHQAASAWHHMQAMFNALPRLNRRQRAALLRPHGTSKSVLQRVVGLRVDPGTGWHMLLPYAVVVLAACSGMLFESALTATLLLGPACMWAVAVPLATRSAHIAQSAKEHALWMLLPGMPQGVALNRALATRFLKDSLVTWTGVAVLSMAPSFFPPTTDPWDGIWLWLFVIGLLPSIVFSINDWSRLPLATTALPTSGGALWCVAGPLLCIAAFVMGATVWLLTLGSVLATVLLLGWRWRQLDNYPTALPAGRLR